MEVSVSLKKAIEEYINGDSSAFTTIYDESKKYVYVCVYNVLKGNDNAEDMIQDAVQDTFVEISKHINSLQNVNQFLSWAGTIAIRKCYEYIKKSNKYVLLNEDESFDNLSDDDNIIPEEIMQNKEKQRLLREIINKELTEMQKLCVVGFYYNDMKQSEIAKELGIPENTVKSNLLRAKARIKDGVLDLEKNKGTKLYAAAPLFLLLFIEDVKACEVPAQIGDKVLSAVSGVGKVTMALSKKILIGVLAAVGTAGVVAGSIIAVKSAQKDTPQEVVGQEEQDITTANQDSEESQVTEEQIDWSTQIIPEGCYYYDASEGKELHTGECFPAEPGRNDIYYTTEYKSEYQTLYVNSYAYGGAEEYVCESWNVRAGRDFQGGEILESILGYPVTDMVMTFDGMYDLYEAPRIPSSVKTMLSTFSDCYNLTEMPEIPDSVINMYATFLGCESLVKVSKIPDSVENINFAFSGCISLVQTPEFSDNTACMYAAFSRCTNLTTVSKLPENLLNMERTFSGCRNLTKAPEIPDGVINMEGAFIGSGIYKAPVLPDSVTNLKHAFFQCINMTETSKIPNGVVNMEGTFQGCESLTVTPEISDSVINMTEAFKDCINLVKVSKISDNVTNLDYAFEGCTELTAAPVIPDSVTSMYATFSGCRALTSVPSIPENVVNMTLTFESCQNLSGEIVINANPKEYAGCFKYVYFKNQNLTLSGSSSLLDELKSTGR